MVVMRQHSVVVEMAVFCWWRGVVDLGVECLGGRESLGCFFSLYGCSDRTRVSGVFLRELALGPLMTFGRFDLTVLLASGTVVGTVGDDHTKLVKFSARTALDDFLILIFSFLLALISSDFLSNICNKNDDTEICK